MRIERIATPRTPEEAEIYRLIAQEERKYREAIQPYIDRLAALEECRMPRYFIVPEPGDDAPIGVKP